MPFVHGLIDGSLSGDDVLEEVSRQFLSGTREEINKLAADVTAGATSLSFTYDLTSISPGAQVDIDLETYRVWTTNEGAKTAVVEPGMNASTTASHDAGTLVHVNTRLPKSQIFKALNDDIASLSSPMTGLFRMKSVTFTYTNTNYTYDLGVTDVLDIYEVRQKQIGPYNYWRALKGWRHDRHNGLFIPDAVHGQTIQVIYKAPFGRLLDASDDLEAVAGVPPEMQDILVMGTLLRLGPIREIKRNFTESQPNPRRADEVPPSATANSFAPLRMARQQRVNDEQARLLQKYPPFHP